MYLVIKEGGRWWGLSSHLVKMTCSRIKMKDHILSKYLKIDFNFIGWSAKAVGKEGNPEGEQ